MYRNGHGYVKPGREDLRPYLARRKKRRTPQGLRKSHRILKGTLPSIDDRPGVVNLRTEIGHWEDDLVVSRESADNLKQLTRESLVLCLSLRYLMVLLKLVILPYHNV